MPNTKVNGILRHREECGWENSNVAPPEVRELFMPREILYQGGLHRLQYKPTQPKQGLHADLQREQCQDSVQRARIPQKR